MLEFYIYLQFLLLGLWNYHGRMGIKLKISILGAIRSAAQMVSYEVSIGIIIINVLLCVGSLNLNDIVLAQENLVRNTSFPMFVIFISALAETNRPPFDLPEAEAGCGWLSTEYSGMMYAMFWLGEAKYSFNVCYGLYTFSWRLVTNNGCLSIKYHSSSCLDNFENFNFVLLFALIKTIVPRYRYDQLMRLGWKIFLPFSLIYLVLTASFYFTSINYQR